MSLLLDRLRREALARPAKSGQDRTTAAQDPPTGPALKQASGYGTVAEPERATRPEPAGQATRTEPAEMPLDAAYLADERKGMRLGRPAGRAPYKQRLSPAKPQGSYRPPQEAGAARQPKSDDAVPMAACGPSVTQRKHYANPCPNLPFRDGTYPMDYRFSIERQEWIHDPGWWRRLQTNVPKH